MRQKSVYFLGCQNKKNHNVWQILGLPYDQTSSFRRGSLFGPQEIRLASQSIETYSPYCKRNLDNLSLCDAGDLKIQTARPERAVSIIADYYQKRYKSGKHILAIGGEHTVTIGAVRGIVEAGIKPYVLQLDAHLDLRTKYTGGKNSHACVARRLAELIGDKRLIQWGSRSGEKSEFKWAESKNTFAGNDAKAFKNICRQLKKNPVYLTLDLDLFDPAIIPGVGNPELGGLNFAEFLNLLTEIENLNIIGADVVELSPVWDLTGRSSIAAAEIVRELLLTIVR